MLEDLRTGYLQTYMSPTYLNQGKWSPMIKMER